MDQPYEFITFGTSGATGHAFGCDCCVDDVYLPDREVLTELSRTAEMYHQMSMRYRTMAGAVSQYGLNRVLDTLQGWKLIVETKRRYDAALRHDADPDSAGTYGKRWAGYGATNCHSEWRTAQARFSKTDQRIAKAMDWEEVW